jgi:hypothetical protein
MKYLIFLFISFLAFASIGQEAKFTVDKATHKFKDTEEGVLLTHVFRVTNTGTAPLIIKDYRVACPCTKVELPKSPIAPGQTIDMKVSFDTNGKKEWQDRAILLQTNTKKKEEKLRIKVYVLPKNG